jgi:hypothetical protein
VPEMDEIRKNFHNDLESVRAEVIRLGASLTESIPRATAVLLSGDLEGADYLKCRVLKFWHCRLRLPLTYGK